MTRKSGGEELKKISAAIIAFNEEDKIERALSSLQEVSDEILVVDSLSTDTTRQICLRYADRILDRRWEGYRKQKQFATDQATYDWVLSLDSDEMLSPRLRQEIIQWKMTADGDCNGYYLARKTFFMGRWVEHTTWYPDWQLRLFRRSRGRWEGGRVHESFRVLEPTAKLRGHLYHYTYASFSEYLVQLERFSTLAAADYYERGLRANLPHLLLGPPAVFLKNYLLRLGFLDGIPGLLVSSLSAVSTLFKYLKLWEMQSGHAKMPADPFADH